MSLNQLLQIYRECIVYIRPLICDSEQLLDGSDVDTWVIRRSHHSEGFTTTSLSVR